MTTDSPLPATPEQADFAPRMNPVQLLIFGVGFGGMGVALGLSILNTFRYTEVGIDDVLVDMLLPGLFWLGGMAFAWSLLRLPFRLHIESGGLRRRTWFGPHFVPWSAVRAAQVGVVRGYVGLELRIGRWRWILIPLTGYGRPRALLEAVAQRLPAGVVLQRPAHLVLEDRPLYR